METLERFNAVGAITNSALYLAALVLAGIAAGAHVVVALAIGTAGVAYLSYAFRLGMPTSRIALALSAASNLTGVAAGAMLLVRYWG